LVHFYFTPFIKARINLSVTGYLSHNAHNTYIITKLSAIILYAMTPDIVIQKIIFDRKAFNAGITFPEYITY